MANLTVQKIHLIALGRLLPNPAYPQEWQLVWSAVSDDQEAYASSFVIQLDAFESTASNYSPVICSRREIVGVLDRSRRTEWRFLPALCRLYRYFVSAARMAS